MPLSPLAPDPVPTDAELAHHWKLEAARLSRSGFMGLPRRGQWFFAFLSWKKQFSDPDAFRVPYMHDRKAYQKSSEWKKIRNRVLVAASHKCACCPGKATEVHHREYRPRVLRGEDTGPLVPICRKCHDTVHWSGPRHEDSFRDWDASERVLVKLVSHEDDRLKAA